MINALSPGHKFIRVLCTVTCRNWKKDTHLGLVFREQILSPQLFPRWLDKIVRLGFFFFFYPLFLQLQQGSLRADLFPKPTSEKSLCHLVCSLAGGDSWARTHHLIDTALSGWKQVSHCFVGDGTLWFQSKLPLKVAVNCNTEYSVTLSIFRVSSDVWRTWAHDLLSHWLNQLVHQHFSNTLNSGSIKSLIDLAYITTLGLLHHCKLNWIQLTTRPTRPF